MCQTTCTIRLMFLFIHDPSDLTDHNKVYISSIYITYNSTNNLVKPAMAETELYPYNNNNVSNKIRRFLNFLNMFNVFPWSHTNHNAQVEQFPFLSKCSIDHKHSSRVNVAKNLIKNLSGCYYHTNDVHAIFFHHVL